MCKNNSGIGGYQVQYKYMSDIWESGDEKVQLSFCMRREV